jgi:PD-(D/E)XK endonuclease
VAHPKDVGDRSTLAIILALHARGCTTFLPFGENTRADLIADYGDRLARIQCKTGRLLNGAVEFRTASTYLHHPNPKLRTRSYHGQIDEFGVFCPESGSVYVVPIADLPNRTMAMLRVEPPRNHQVQGIRLAATYEIARIALY